MSIDLAAHLAQDYPEVTPHEFYRAIFPPGELDTWKSFTPGKYTGIIMTLKQDGHFCRRYTLTDDFHDLDKAINSNRTCFLTPASYAGKKRESQCARVLYALAIDLDYVDEERRYSTLITQIEHGEDLGFFGLPRPTFLVASGTGLHIYYVLQEPVPCYDANLQKLQKLKSRLTWQAWTQGAAAIGGDLRRVQYEPVLQAHRMVGSVTKVGTRTRAFRTGVPITIEEMDEYVPEDYRCGDLMYISALSLEDAKDLYPEWYDRRIVRQEPRGTWPRPCHRGLYEWWIRQIREGATEGHRYWVIFVLVTYAVKCDIPKEEVRQDAYDLVPFLNTRGKTAFTRDDVDAAMQAYDPCYKTYSIQAIEYRTGIHIERNRRNGRTRDQHLKRVHALAKMDQEEGKGAYCHCGRKSAGPAVQEWRTTHPCGTQAACAKDLGITWQTVHRHWTAAGEPMTNLQRVQVFRQAHPDGSKAECARETGLSRQTVYKYWED